MEGGGGGSQLQKEATGGQCDIVGSISGLPGSGRQLMAGEGGKRHSNTLDPQEEAGIQGTPDDNVGILVITT